MKVTPVIIQHEFIGLEAKVVKSSNPSYVGISGKIIDETRNTFVILQDGKRKTVIKDQAVFQFTFPDATIVEIDGKVYFVVPYNAKAKKRFF